MFEDVRIVLNGVQLPGLSWRDVLLTGPRYPGDPYTASIHLVVDSHRYEYPDGNAEPIMIVNGHSKQTGT